jgi:endonuclease/exonuclease/phosphatase family metal-dependent hydrolase
MKLLTWNVQWFLGLDGVVDVTRVLDHARSLCDFDVLCLQEVSVHLKHLKGGGDFDQVAKVAKLLPDHEVIFTP